MDANRIISTVDLHVAGEPLRIIKSGVPPIKGRTQPDRRAYCMEHLDGLRKTLMNEPRGHHGMYGCIITSPATEEADFGVLFMHNEGWSTMCGHGIIAVVTMVIETGEYMVEDGHRKFIIDSPAGQVVAYAHCEGKQVIHVSFENVASFLYEKDYPVKIDNQEITADIAFGGAFYAIIDSNELHVQLDHESLPKLQSLGMKIKYAIEATINIQHPLQDDLKGIYGVIFSGNPSNSNADLKNVTIFADHQIDRSPCGTGTSARVAALYANGELEKSESFFHESITGGVFQSAVIADAKVTSFDAVIPEVSGTASITGFHQFVVDERDFLPEGFLI
ncbi:proline racemase family protein [Virgibacillus siamensis]|uniref:proline racemase family protein n=1 Tax=Virgibacillus siamensis TaxID=480071 RepID=UPI0011159283|nr:proline racemase family protein [Virgibacillus siamensis]